MASTAYNQIPEDVSPFGLGAKPAIQPPMTGLPVQGPTMQALSAPAQSQAPGASWLTLGSPAYTQQFGQANEATGYNPYAGNFGSIPQPITDMIQKAGGIGSAEGPGGSQQFDANGQEITQQDLLNQKLQQLGVSQGVSSDGQHWGYLDSSGQPIQGTVDTGGINDNDFWTASSLAAAGLTGGLAAGAIGGAGVGAAEGLGGAAATGGGVGLGAGADFSAGLGGLGGASFGGGTGELAGMAGSSGLGTFGGTLEGASAGLAGAGAEGALGTGGASFEYPSVNTDQFGLSNTSADTVGSTTPSGGDLTKDALFGNQGYTGNVAGVNMGATAPTAASGLSSLLPDGTPDWLSSALSSFGNGLGDTASKAGQAALVGSILQHLGPQTPATPNFGAIAQQQGAANQQTAAINNQMNRVDTTTPFGSQTFGQVADPSVPGGVRYTSNIALSPAQQGLLNSTQQNQQAKLNIAGGMQNQVANAVSQPFDLGGLGSVQKVTSDPNAYANERQQAQDATYQRLTSLRMPQMQQQRDAMDNQLKNQGLVPGTQAYDTAMKNLMDSQGTELSNDAMQAVTAGGTEQSRIAADLRSNATTNNQGLAQSTQQYLLGRQEPLNEFNAYANGTQATLPQFQAYGMSTAQPAPIAQAGTQQYGANADQYNAQLSNFQNLLNFGTSLYKTPTITGP